MSTRCWEGKAFPRAEARGGPWEHCSVVAETALGRAAAVLPGSYEPKRSMRNIFPLRGSSEASNVSETMASWSMLPAGTLAPV